MSEAAAAGAAGADAGAAAAAASAAAAAATPWHQGVEPEILGSRIDPGSLSCEPKIAEEAWTSCEEVELQDIPTLMKGGRIGTVIEAAHLLKQRNPDLPVVASVSGPVSTAAAVVSPMTFLKEMRTRAADAHRVMDYVTRLLEVYIREAIANGADVIAVGDPTATGEILGPKIFREFAVRYLNRLCDAAHAMGKPIIIHICGDMSRSRDQLAELDADAISSDAKVNLRSLKEDYPSITTMGNLSTHLLEFGDSRQVSRSVERLLRDGIDIISPACGLSTSTTLENIRALTDTVRLNEDAGKARVL